MYETIFVQTRLYESLFIAITNCVQVYFSNRVYGSFYCGIVVMVCTAKLYGSLFITTTDCVQVYFSNIVYGSFYCGMVVMVYAGNCMKHYLSKHYMEVYLLLLQIVSKYIFPI